ncbi:hypothetical protein SCHPADRAFT_930227 [Schizopora paradoxa]|uniref:Uncharacterized protein n=1 Tax=Schizopora paradoxa TaxID=27342 RepID=A0A0H2RHB2_9AGAM|nr:hypothetical protein SCHPADRAFT_930227 [Schizopora paradoxa]
MDSGSSSSSSSTSPLNKRNVIINVSEEKRNGAMPNHDGDEIDVETMKEIAEICANRIIDAYELPATSGTKIEIIAWSSFSPHCCVCDVIVVRLSDSSWSENANFLVDLFPTIAVSKLYHDRHMQKFVKYHSR